MNKEKLKLIIKNLESLVDCLKSEVYSDVDSYKPQYEEVSTYIEDYDEVFYDEDGEMLYDYESVNKKYKLTNDDDGDGL
jgi:lipopolysaccharide export LptBFGC system permease protein LptF